MSVSFLRIDDRMIHGQTVTRWSLEYPCDGLIAVNDKAATTDALKMAYKSASTKKTFVWTYEAWKKKNQKYILLQVSDTAATARILEQQMALQVGEYSIQDTTSVKIFKTTIDREALVRELTLQGVGLSGLAEKDDTLEDYFKKITGGEGIA